MNIQQSVRTNCAKEMKSCQMNIYKRIHILTSRNNRTNAEQVSSVVKR